MRAVTIDTAFIDGEPVAPGDRVRALIDPASGQPFAEVADSDVAMAERAVAVAHDRFVGGDWRDAPVRERRDVLRRIADLIRRDAERLARIESQNVGKPITAARGEVGAAAEVFDYYAGAVDKVGGSTVPGNADGTLLTFREPLGVCLAITPWNFPLLILAWKTAPALALGNSVVAKPASATPLSALALARAGGRGRAAAGRAQRRARPGRLAGRRPDPPSAGAQGVLHRLHGRRHRRDEGRRR